MIPKWFKIEENCEKERTWEQQKADELKKFKPMKTKKYICTLY